MDAFNTTINLQQDLDALSGDLRDIESLLKLQLDNLAESMPEIYSGYASMVRQITDATLNMFNTSSKTASKIAIAAEIGARSIKAFGEYKAAKQHNEIIRKYMHVKTQIANNNLTRVNYALPKAELNCQKTAKLFDKCCEIRYCLNELNDDKFRIISSIQEKTLNIHRTNLYMFELCKYLKNEYTAWINNNHKSEFDMPDYYLINSILAEKLYGEDLLGSYSEAADQTSVISGKQIMLLYDYSLSLMALGSSLCNVNISEAHPLVGQLMDNCGAHKKYAEWVKPYKEHVDGSSSSAIYLLGIITTIAIICIIVFYFDCSATVKLITFLASLGAILKICIKGVRKVHIAEVQKGIDMANEIDGIIACNCGKVDRPDIDYQERNELSAVISGFLN